MPAVDTILLPLVVGLTLLGVIITGIAWRRGRRGRVVQGVGLTLVPVALYLSGLLRLLWNGIVALGTWAANLVFSPLVWLGMGLLGLCLVLWVVGGLIARRSGPASASASAPKAVPAAGSATAAGLPAGKGKARTGRTPAKSEAEVDPELAEIEALLKSRGIE